MDKQTGNRKKYWGIYTIVFLLMAGAVYSHFFLNGKSFVYTDDGWKQHFKALVYYAKWLRSIVYNLLENHVFEIPQFSFSIGYGSDILTTLHYYVIGDPLNLFSVFVPTRYMAYFYSGLVLVRLYLAGICFSSFCFYKNVRNKVGILAGSMSYIFCGFALYASVRHPYFANPMIYFPLLLLGVEKILKEKKPWIFMITVCISAMSSFYFFYMLVLFTVLYVILRMCCIYNRKEIGKAIISIMKIGGYSVVGVMMSAVIFLPVVLLFVNNPRSSNTVEYSLVYARKYYEQMMTGFVTYKTVGNWNFMGYSVVVLIAIIMLFFVKRKHKAAKYSFIVLTAFLLIPTVGHIFNGFSYVSNRWIWGYSMLVSYILAIMWEELLKLTKNKKICLILIMSGYFLCCFRFNETYKTSGLKFACLIGICAVFIILMTGVARKKELFKLLECGLLFLVLANIVGIAYYEYSPQKTKYLDEFLNIADVYDTLMANEARAVTAVEDEEEFYRYSGDVYNATNANSTLISGLSSVQFYWSLSNSTIAPFMEQMCLLDNSAYNYKKLDNRTSLNTLAGVKYYITGASSSDGKANYVPYGYEEVVIEGELGKTYKIYENQYALPLGYTYSDYIKKDEYEQLNAIEKQEALLQGVLLEDEIEGFEQVDLKLTNNELDYSVTCNSNQITQQNNSFVVTEKNSSITLEFEGLENSETYLLLEGLRYKGFSSKQLYTDDMKVDPLNLYIQKEWNELSKSQRNAKNQADKNWEEATELVIQIDSINTNGQRSEKTLYYRTPRYTWYAGRHDFAVNMCYDEVPKKSITITFPKIGIYSFDNLSVICQPMDEYSEYVEKLGTNVLESVNMHNGNIAYATNKVTGKISVETPQILCITVPYSEGWTAFVDGIEQKVLQANTMFMAIPLEAGEHEICLIYHTPGLRVGVAVSCLGCLAFGFMFLVDRKKRFLL